MSHLKRLSLILALIALVACSATPGSPLTQNRQKWESQHITHYRFSLTVGCFCVFSDKMPVSIEIQDGQVVSMLDNQGQPVTDFKEALDQYASIDKLFDKIAAAQKDGAEQVDVEYNANYGYPQSVSIDGSKQIADDEISFGVSNFEILK